MKRSGDDPDTQRPELTVVPGIPDDTKADERPVAAYGGGWFRLPDGRRGGRRGARGKPAVVDVGSDDVVVDGCDADGPPPAV